VPNRVSVGAGASHGHKVPTPSGLEHVLLPGPSLPKQPSNRGAQEQNAQRTAAQLPERSRTSASARPASFFHLTPANAAALSAAAALACRLAAPAAAAPSGGLTAAASAAGVAAPASRAGPLGGGSTASGVTAAGGAASASSPSTNSIRPPAQRSPAPSPAEQELARCVPMLAAPAWRAAAGTAK